MIVTLVAVLEGIAVLPGAFWAAGAAIVVASVWTSFALRLRVAEIRVDGPWVQVRSVADVVLNQAEPPQRVLDVRDYGSWADVTVGLTSYQLNGAVWPAFEELLDALEATTHG